MNRTAPSRLRQFEAALVRRLRVLAEAPEMLAIRWALPLSFVGLVAGLVFFMLEQGAGTFLARFYHSFAAAFGLMSATLVVVLTFDLARRRAVSPWVATTCASLAFAASLPYRAGRSFEELAKALGSSGLFLAIGIAMITVFILSVASRRTGPVAGALLTVLVVFGGALGLRAAGISLTDALDVLIAPLGMLGDSLTALLVITLVETLLWTVGIHGPALLAAVVLPVYIHLQAENTDALAHGLPLPHIVTVSIFLFVFPGGAGATLPLVLLLLRSKVKRARTVAYATLVPTLFNANEPLMFGLPLVLNPYLSLPFVLAPLALALVTWEAMHLGLVNRPALYMPSSIPLPLSVYLATKDWRSIVLVAFNIGLALAIYFPFVRLYARQQTRAAPPP